MMLSLPSEAAAVLQPFARLFAQQRSWMHAQVLLVGLLLCHGKRTVSRILQVMGLSAEEHYTNYYRVLNRVKWSGLEGSKILLESVIRVFGVKELVIGVDDTLERRWGKKIWGIGIYRDPVRSSTKHTVKCSGLKWVVMQILVSVPWSSRPWALPVMTVLAPSQAANQRAGQRHKTSLDWAIGMMKQINRWVKRPWILVGDGSFGTLKVGWACRRCGVSLLSRLRLDANLYEFAPVHDPHRKGKRPLKGARLPSLKQLLAHHQSPKASPLHPSLRDRFDLPQLMTRSLRWYGDTTVVRHLYTGTALWHTDGYPPLPIRWVLVFDPSGKQDPAALFSTSLHLDPQFIVETFVERWSLEVTFEEARAHLGFQSQRHFSKLATERGSALILASVSITCLIAYALHRVNPLLPRSTAWYPKSQPSFSDLLEAVRSSLWQTHPAFTCSFSNPDLAIDFMSYRQQWISLLASSL